MLSAESDVQAGRAATHVASPERRAAAATREEDVGEDDSGDSLQQPPPTAPFMHLMAHTGYIFVGIALAGAARPFGAMAYRGTLLWAAASTALSPSEWWLCFAAATGAQAISIASLLNPSPLSLVPGVEEDETALGGIKRDDRRKLRPYGLTRITRHPLILPVVPWGAANALLAGAQ